MEALSLNKAIELYEILGPHIPEIDENEDAWNFIGKIVRNIANSDPEAYTLSIELMSNITLRELQDMSSEERLLLFSNGLSNNQILDLKSFCDYIGYKHA
jgi:hypothetical protein